MSYEEEDTCHMRRRIHVIVNILGYIELRRITEY
jgi:hypothetical protein